LIEVGIRVLLDRFDRPKGANVVIHVKSVPNDLLSVVKGVLLPTFTTSIHILKHKIHSRYFLHLLMPTVFRTCSGSGRVKSAW
jgi:hypothetical protein